LYQRDPRDPLNSEKSRLKRTLKSLVLKRHAKGRSYTRAYKRESSQGGENGSRSHSLATFPRSINLSPLLINGRLNFLTSGQTSTTKVHEPTSSEFFHALLAHAYTPTRAITAPSRIPGIIKQAIDYRTKPRIDESTRLDTAWSDLNSISRHRCGSLFVVRFASFRSIYAKRWMKR